MLELKRHTLTLLIWKVITHLFSHYQKGLWIFLEWLETLSFIFYLIIVVGFDKFSNKENIFSIFTLVVLFESIRTKWEFFWIFRQTNAQDTSRIEERSTQNEDFGAGLLELEDSRWVRVNILQEFRSNTMYKSWDPYRFFFLFSSLFGYCDYTKTRINLSQTIVEDQFFFQWETIRE